MKTALPCTKKNCGIKNRFKTYRFLEESDGERLKHRRYCSEIPDAGNKCFLPSASFIFGLHFMGRCGYRNKNEIGGK